MDLLQVIGKPWTCCKSLENYGPAASHTKIMKKSLENHGPAESHWKIMNLLQII
jgi:hypothetical protein